MLIAHCLLLRRWITQLIDREGKDSTGWQPQPWVAHTCSCPGGILRCSTLHSAITACLSATAAGRDSWPGVRASAHPMEFRQQGLPGTKHLQRGAITGPPRSLHCRAQQTRISHSAPALAEIVHNTAATERSRGPSVQVPGHRSLPWATSAASKTPPAQLSCRPLSRRLRPQGCRPVAAAAAAQT